MHWQGKGFSCHVEIIDTLAYLFQMHSCRSLLEAPFHPSKIILKSNIDQYNNEKVKAVLQSGASEEASGEHLHCVEVLQLAAFVFFCLQLYNWKSG